MDCKNCDRPLRTDYSFCSNCGAKIIRNRLTMKNLWHDVTERFFNIDNTFIRTFLHLFSKPEVVIGGYISGVRKKYLNPISYLTVALLLSGLAFLILKNVYGITLTEVPNGNATLAAKMDRIYDYQTLMAYSSLPIYAALTWLFFLDKNKYNFTEHFLISIYTVAQYSIIQFVVIIPLFGFFNVNYTNFSLVFMLIVVFYQFYVLKKLHQTKIFNTIIRALGYLVLMMITVTIVYTIIFFLMLWVTGDFNLEDFAPKK